MNNQAQGVAQASQKPSKSAPMAGQVRASGIRQAGARRSRASRRTSR